MATGRMSSANSTSGLATTTRACGSGQPRPRCRFPRRTGWRWPRCRPPAAPGPRCRTARSAAGRPACGCGARADPRPRSRQAAVSSRLDRPRPGSRTSRKVLLDLHCPAHFQEVPRFAELPVKAGHWSPRQRLRSCAALRSPSAAVTQALASWLPDDETAACGLHGQGWHQGAGSSDRGERRCCTSRCAGWPGIRCGWKTRSAIWRARSARPWSASRAASGTSLYIDPAASSIEFESFWASHGSLVQSEEAIAASACEAARRAERTVTRERYEVVVYEREAPWRRGQGCG